MKRQVTYKKHPIRNNEGRVVNHWHSVEIFEGGVLKRGLGEAGPITNEELKTLIQEASRRSV